MITGIILASGYSRRMKEDKLLMEVDGVKMVESVIQKTKGSALDRIILVYRKEEIRDIGDKYNIESLYNPRAKLGQSEGLKLGVENAHNSDAYMFLLGDQPFITREWINILIDEYKNNSDFIIVPYYKEKRGMPTIFPVSFREDLLKIRGDRGGRNIIKENPLEVKKIYTDNERLGFDIDDQEDFKRC